jgi:polysaccharide biosynthesis/export protein
MEKKFCSLLLILLFLTSCVPYKDTIYLNKNKSNNAIEVNAEAYKPYRIQSADILNVTISALDEKMVAVFNKSKNVGLNASEQSAYFEGYQVDDKGEIKIPVLGNVKVVDLTVDEIAKLIENKLLQDYFTKQANLLVNVKLAGIRYTTNGEIAGKGTKVVYQDRLTILEAIANAGDILDTGDKTDVTIMRKTPVGFETYVLDLTDARVINSPYFYVKPNDYIYVKPLKQKNIGVGLNGLQTVTTILSLFGVVTTTYFIIKTL